jgi:glycosyltransferase involved in cell wall biosynthesis
VDIERFRPGGSRQLRVELGWGASFVVLSARAHEPVYAMPVVIEGFRRAAARRPEVRLLVLGDGSERPELEAAVNAAGLGSRVHFAGSVGNDRLPAFYAAADCYVSASHVDGSSVSLLEAMAAGLPAVATAVGGNPEWITPGRTGWLVPVDDADALGSALIEAASSPLARQHAMGAAARSVAVTRADWQRNANVFIAAVSRAASAGHGTPLRSVDQAGP